MPYNDYRTALVTGASTGMGEAITRCLVAHDITVHAVARNESSLQKLAAELGVIPHALDLRDLDAVAEQLSGLEIDILVNCAGVSRPGNVLDSSADDLDALVDVNLRAILQLARILVPGMVERDLGHVINISSIAGIYNFYGHTAYHATKAAVHQLSRQLRNDTVGRRIRVTEICPAASRPRSSDAIWAALPRPCKRRGRPTTRAMSRSPPRTSSRPSISRSPRRAI